MKARLSLQFNLGLIIALLLAFGVAGSAWWVAYEFDSHIESAYSDQLAGAVQLAEAESALWQLRYGFPQFMLGDAATRQRVLDDEAKWYALVAGRLDAYAKGNRAPQELEALAVLRAEYTRYIAARPRFFDLWQAGRREEAADWRAMTTTPYGTATMAAFERQIEQQRAVSEQGRIEAQQHVTRARRAVMAMTGTLILLLALSYLVVRRVLDPIRRLQQEAVNTMREQFGENLDISAKANEVQALEASLRAMTARFTAHSVELTQARETLAAQSSYLEGTVATRTAELERTVARMERQNREITLRNELGDLLQSCVSIEEAGAVMVRFVPLLFAGASGAAYMATPGAESLVAVARWGEDTAEVMAATDCWALRRGKTHLVSAADESLHCAHVATPLAGASICVPLAAHGEAIGLLHLTIPDPRHSGESRNPVVNSGESRNPAPDSDVTLPERQQLAEAVAAQIGMALGNLHLRQTLHQQSIRDILSGLYNRRYLEAALPRELSRAQRGKRPLAVFMLDVDHFKKFNDSCGHEAGDAVLKTLGKLLRDNCRQGDIACRFGGEEFTLILPDADEAAAREWAERLMQRVRTMEVKANGQTLPGITISMGLALMPTHGNEAETLMQAADLALYDAKHAGRDRLVVSGENRT